MKEETDWLGTSEPKEWHGSEFPAFAFCLIYPRPEVKEVGNMEMPTDTKKRGPQKRGLAPAKEQAKSQTSKTENFKTGTDLFQPNTTEKV